MPSIFKDLYKPVKDLLTKNYNGEKNKLEIKTKDSVTFNPVFTREKAGDVSSTISVEGEYDPCNWAHLKLKYEVDTKGKLTTKVTVDKTYPGLKWEATADLALGDDTKKDSYELRAEYKTKLGNVVGTLNHKNSSLVAEVSGVYELQHLTAGAAAVFDVSSSKLKNQSLGAAYSISRDTSIIGNLTDLNKLTAGFITSSKGNTFAGEYAASVSKPKEGIVTVGWERGIAGGHTAKAKVSSLGVVAGSLSHKLSPEWKITTSLELDVTKGSSAFGTTFSYDA